VFFESHPRGIECARRPTQIAGDQRDFGLGDDAPRAGHGFAGTEGASSAAKERLRFCEIAELRHRDAAKRECSRVVAKRNAFQRAERITRGERTSRSCD
jgi:hypothetical protein